MRPSEEQIVTELLKPRYQVIADYPGSEYPVNLILTEELPGHFTYQTGGRTFTARIKDINYPHLFRRMNWWENRTENQMPKRVKSMADDKGDTFEIVEWDMSNLIGWIDKKERTCCSLLIWTPEHSYVPVF